jgi:septal ring factor EnvC (AmiA/AmiB activator)
MGSSKTLKDTVKRAQKEVKKLLTEVETGKSGRSKLEAGLYEVKSDLKVIDFHLDRIHKETKLSRKK